MDTCLGRFSGYGPSKRGPEEDPEHAGGMGIAAEGDVKPTLFLKSHFVLYSSSF